MGEIGNKNALKYKSKKKLEEGIQAYFDLCDEQKKPYTITGLANSLGIDRDTLRNYAKQGPYSALIKNAKQKVEEMLEESLYRLGNNSGVIFNLKNNYGWKDEQKVEVTNETPTLKINVVDNSELEKAMYDETN